MLDIQLRPLKDNVFNPLCQYVPLAITPLHVTTLAFLCGLLCCFCSFNQQILLSLIFWALNRALDCLDGALARQRGTASELGGFLDLLGDFIIYSLLPIAIAAGQNCSPACLITVALLEASFHVNNFVLFYVAAIVEKRAHAEKQDAKAKELTSVAMRPAIVEGAESGIFFTLMIVYPERLKSLSAIMAGLVLVNIIQRSYWLIGAL